MLNRLTRLDGSVFHDDGFRLIYRRRDAGAFFKSHLAAADVKSGHKATEAHSWRIHRFELQVAT